MYAFACTPAGFWLIAKVPCKNRGLKNNKATAFDKVGNEMLKSGATILADALLVESGIFPSSWKTGILHILHKSGS